MDDLELEGDRQILARQLKQAQSNANPVYRIGNQIPSLGLYEVLGEQGEVIGYGQRIFQESYVYGDLVRATKPYGSNVWVLDKFPEPANCGSGADIGTGTGGGGGQSGGGGTGGGGTGGTPSNGFNTIPPTTPPNDPPSRNPPPRKNTATPPNCSPPPNGCRWQDQSIPCNGNIQDYDYAVLNTGTLVLCCDPSVTPDPNGGCSPLRYSCKDGSCYAKATGTYATFAECQAALICEPTVLSYYLALTGSAYQGGCNEADVIANYTERRGGVIIGTPPNSLTEPTQGRLSCAGSPAAYTWILNGIDTDTGWKFKPTTVAIPVTTDPKVVCRCP